MLWNTFPFIKTTQIDSNNTYVTLSFSENIYNATTSGSTTNLSTPTTSNFRFEVNGGTAELSSVLPSSVTKVGGADLSGKWNNNEPNGGNSENHGEFHGGSGKFNDLGANNTRAHVLELRSSISA